MRLDFSIVDFKQEYAGWIVELYPANIYLFKVNNRNTIMWNIFKVNNKNTNWRRSGVFIVNFERISHPFSSVSIVMVATSWKILECPGILFLPWKILEKIQNKENILKMSLIFNFLSVRNSGSQLAAHFWS